MIDVVGEVLLMVLGAFFFRQICCSFLVGMVYHWYYMCVFQKNEKQYHSDFVERYAGSYHNQNKP